MPATGHAVIREDSALAPSFTISESQGAAPACERLLKRPMPTLTLAPGTMQELGIKADALNTSPLTPEVLRPLSALLVSRGFEVALPIAVVPIEGGGFLLTQ